MSLPDARPPSLSIAALAIRLGVREGTVRKAVQSGRITAECYTMDMDGTVLITDVAGAERDFWSNQDVVKHHHMPSASSPRGWSSVSRARAQLIRQQTRKLELANRERRRQLVSRKAVEGHYGQRVVTGRDKFLALPARFKLEVGHSTDSDLQILDRLIRDT